MKKLTGLMVVALAPLLISLTSAGEEKSFSSPTFNGTPVDYCLRHGDMSSCGRESAKAFCVAQGLPGVQSFKGYVVVPAAITMSGQACSGQCWAFESITCGEPGPSAASSAGSVIPHETPPTNTESIAVIPGGSSFEGQSKATFKSDEQRAEEARRQAELAEERDRALRASRTVLRGYWSGRNLTPIQQIGIALLGQAPPSPFRFKFQMTGKVTEARELLETGEWHGTDPAEGSMVGLPKHFLGQCDNRTKLKRTPASSGASYGGVNQAANDPPVISPPVISLPPEMDDYANGCMGIVYGKQVPGTVPLFRYLDPRNGAQFYTTSEAEGSNAEQILGFQPKGVCCFVLPGPQANTKPVFRVMCSETGHFYTPVAFVRDWMVLKGECQDEGVAFHVWDVSVLNRSDKDLIRQEIERESVIQGN